MGRTLAELEVCRAERGESEGDKEQDPDEHHVGPTSGKGEEVGVDGPEDEVVTKGDVVLGGASGLRGKQAGLDRKAWVEEAAESKPKAAERGEDERRESVTDDEFQDAGDVERHATHKVVRSNEGEERVGRGTAPAHQAARGRGEGEDERDNSESGRVTQRLDQAQLSARLDVGLQIQFCAGTNVTTGWEGIELQTSFQVTTNAPLY